jgi:hypothetical protein
MITLRVQLAAEECIGPMASGRLAAQDFRLYCQAKRDSECQIGLTECGQIGTI